VLALVAILFLITRSHNGARHAQDRVPSGQPPAVIVTVMDEEGGYSKSYLDLVKENRVRYAEKLGMVAPFLPVSVSSTPTWYWC